MYCYGDPMVVGYFAELVVGQQQKGFRKIAYYRQLTMGTAIASVTVVGWATGDWLCRHNGLEWQTLNAPCSGDVASVK